MKQRNALACTGNRIAVLALVLSGSLFSRAGAQSIVTSQTESSLRNTIGRIAADNRRIIRVATRETGRLEGDSVSLVDDSLFVNTEAGRRAIAVANVDSVWTYRGTAAPILGLIAAVPCAIFGASVGGFVGGDPDSQGSSGKAALFSVVGLVAGGAVCGLLGAGVGSLIERWRLEYVRSRPAAT